MYSKGAIFQAVTNFQNCSNFCANNNTAFGHLEYKGMFVTCYVALMNICL